MQSRKRSVGLTVVLAIITVAPFVTGTRAAAQQEGVLHSFNKNGKDGYFPEAGVISDAAGNLYGTTYYGGTGKCVSGIFTGCGIVFELTPKAGGGWTEKVLHNFSNNGKDGYYPAAGLVFDAAGNLYGTTAYGGTGVCSSVAPTGCGTVFELTPKTGGGWVEGVLHSFGGGADGEIPESGLIFDPAGHLFGTTAGIGGTCTHYYVECGTLFELTPHGGGGWTEKVLHNFSSTDMDGYGPYGSLVQDAAGNLYGGTYFGGAFGDGAVFELTPVKGGSWTEQVLYSFFYKGNFGGGPGSLILNGGNLFGTTPTGGTSYSGAVFELTPAAGGSWNQTVLYNFDVYTTGATTNSSLIIDAAGKLYGTNQFGGAGAIVCLIFGGGIQDASCGTVFELTPAGDGSWNQSTLHSFGTGADGQVPFAGLIRDAAGHLYGTTSLGGAHGNGTVFEIRP